MDEDRPSLDDVGRAITPPGASWEDFKAAMRQAHAAGGHAPGQTAPDVSLGGAAAEALKQAIRDGYAAVAGPAPVLPADPFGSPMTPGAVAATALHETFRDMLAGGFTEDQATTILAKMLAYHHGGGDG